MEQKLKTDVPVGGHGLRGKVHGFKTASEDCLFLCIHVLVSVFLWQILYIEM